MIHNSTEAEFPWNQTLDRQFSYNRPNHTELGNTNYFENVKKLEVPSNVIVVNGEPGT